MSGRLYVETPLIESMALSKLAGCTVHLKLENTQPSASFKLRGISHMMQKRQKEGCSRIVASSGGNAGLAAAYAARKMSLPITIYVPGSTPDFMREKLRDQGADVVVEGTVWDHANAKAQEEAKKPGHVYLHPFDDPDVWEGHASMMEEVSVQLEGATPDLVVVAVGGGGLLCGVVQGMARVGWQTVPILAMETAGADSYNQAVRAGRLVTLPDITSIAKCLGALTVAERSLQYYKERPIISQVITDQQCLEACYSFLDDERILVEPACGAAMTAVYAKVIQQLQTQGTLGKLERVVVIVCGGACVSLDQMAEWCKQLGLPHWSDGAQ